MDPNRLKIIFKKVDRSISKINLAHIFSDDDHLECDRQHVCLVTFKFPPLIKPPHRSIPPSFSYIICGDSPRWTKCNLSHGYVHLPRQVSKPERREENPHRPFG